MAASYQCDLCKKFKQGHVNFQLRGKMYINWFPGSNRRKARWRVLDLCPECTDTFSVFVTSVRDRADSEIRRKRKYYRKGRSYYADQSH